MSFQCIEPAIVPDVVISRIAYTQEIASGMWRFTYYNRQICPLDDSLENVIVQKNVFSRAEGVCCAMYTLRILGVRTWCWSG